MAQESECDLEKFMADCRAALSCDPGHAGIYQDGDVHSIDIPEHARFVRVTGTDLDRIHRSTPSPKAA